MEWRLETGLEPTRRSHKPARQVADLSAGEGLSESLFTNTADRSLEIDLNQPRCRLPWRGVGIRKTQPASFNGKQKSDKPAYSAFSCSFQRW